MGTSAELSVHDNHGSHDRIPGGGFEYEDILSAPDDSGEIRWIWRAKDRTCDGCGEIHKAGLRRACEHDTWTYEIPPGYVMDVTWDSADLPGLWLELKFIPSARQRFRDFFRNHFYAWHGVRPGQIRPQVRDCDYVTRCTVLPDGIHFRWPDKDEIPRADYACSRYRQRLAYVEARHSARPIDRANWAVL